MYVSDETPGQTDARLREVIRRSTLVIHDGTYAFEELPLEAIGQLRMDALAHVRDESVWSQLVASNQPDRELFRVFTFHFPPGVDNSGFIGWLGSLLKARFGTGVFVVCGQNSGRGGIFDHWGVGLERSEAVLAAVQALTKPWALVARGCTAAFRPLLTCADVRWVSLRRPATKVLNCQKFRERCAAVSICSGPVRRPVRKRRDPRSFRAGSTPRTDRSRQCA